MGQRGNDMDLLVIGEVEVGSSVFGISEEARAFLGTITEVREDGSFTVCRYPDPLDTPSPT
jgi:hypothetical protein